MAAHQAPLSGPNWRAMPRRRTLVRDRLRLLHPEDAAIEVVQRDRYRRDEHGRDGQQHHDRRRARIAQLLALLPSPQQEAGDRRDDRARDERQMQHAEDEQRDPGDGHAEDVALTPRRGGEAGEGEVDQREEQPRHRVPSGQRKRERPSGWRSVANA
jgi:hypothetical protein